MPEQDDLEESRRNALEEARQRRAEERTRAVYARRKAALAANSQGEDGEKTHMIDIGKDFPMIIALFFAIFKDLIDLVGIGSIPVIGTLVTILITSLIAMMMFLAGASSKTKLAKYTARRVAVLFVGFMIEAFGVGINLIPIETLMVIIIMAMTAAERKGFSKKIIPAKAAA